MHTQFQASNDDTSCYLRQRLDDHATMGSKLTLCASTLKRQMQDEGDVFKLSPVNKPNLCASYGNLWESLFVKGSLKPPDSM